MCQLPTTTTNPPASPRKESCCKRHRAAIIVAGIALLLAAAAGVGIPMALKAMEDDEESASAANRDPSFPSRPSTPLTSTTTTGAPETSSTTPAAETTTTTTTTTTSTLGPITYRPGLLTVQQNGVLLSQGLTSRILAVTGAKVTYANGTRSVDEFHRQPDFGHVFADTRAWNAGGWIYVSNSEVRFPEPPNQAGVGALTFDKDANLVDYRMLLRNSTANCAGGPTPWNTWVSCEEDREGRIWQVDPTGAREPQMLTVGLERTGIYEAFATDMRNPRRPVFFVTEDRMRGVLRRWEPFTLDGSPLDLDWDLLHGPGRTQYLMLTPNDGSNLTGTFVWSDDYEAARENAFDYYKHGEGIDVTAGILTFVTNQGLYFELDLDQGTYVRQLQVFGGIAGGGVTDQIQRIAGNDRMMYFTEDGVSHAGIFARSSSNGRFYPILNANARTMGINEWEGESSGLAFTPDGRYMYMAFQHEGILIEVRRLDGRGFQDEHLEPDFLDYPIRIPDGAPLESDAERR